MKLEEVYEDVKVNKHPNKENVIDALKELVDFEKEQTKQSTKKGQIASSIIFATSWGFLLQGETGNNMWLAIAIFLSIIYFTLDIIRPLMYSYLVRKLYWKHVQKEEKPNEATEIRIEASRYSNRTFYIFFIQILILTLTVIFLGIFICFKYHIFNVF